jgi:hypothetical protein
MKRDLFDALRIWKIDPKRKPLIIRGARQVGKTWLVEHFGKTECKTFFGINFELEPNFKSCFETPDPDEILTRIELTANTTLSGDDTLLFLDEVQECPAAIKALRYFFEMKPGLCVIAAGSLLEFMQQSDTISIPVGRVLNYYLAPLSFGEFLSACREDRLREFIRNLSIGDTVPESIGAKCATLLRTYLYTGGMPAAISDWIDRKAFTATDALHRSLLQNYRQDFGKYGRRTNSEMLEKTFLKIPGLVGSALTYTSIDRYSNTRDVKRAIELLEKARILARIRATSGAGLPMYTYADEKKIKILFLDVGLLQNAMGISSETFLASDLLAVYRGAVTEQFIGQQLLSMRKPFEDPDLFYWSRNAPGSEAEVDYLYQYGEKIIPIEVKSGATGTLRSLRIFLKENNTPFGVRFSMHPLSFHDRVLSIPLFAVEALPRLVSQACALVKK